MTGPHSDALAAALADLARDPEPSRCEAMSIALDGARTHCQLLGEAIRRERSQERGHDQ